MGKTLTVAVAAYNVERYLADSLASYVAAGEDPRLEVLVIDDGSTDSTPLIAAEFARLYPDTFRVITKQNGGHGSAVNAGIEHARGKYFRIIDGDDRICSVNVERLLDALDDAHEDLVIDMKRDVYLDSGKSSLLELPRDLPLESTLLFEPVCNRGDLEAFFMIHTVSVRTDFLHAHEIRLLEHTFYVDYEFIVKIASRAETLRFVDLEACNYFTGNSEQSVAPTNYVRRFADHARVTEELLRFASENRFDDARKAFVNERVRLIVNTHYNIALIFDEDRKRGLARARDFRALLKRDYPYFYAVSEHRYRQALALHFLGFDAARLDKLMGR